MVEIISTELTFRSENLDFSRSIFLIFSEHKQQFERINDINGYILVTAELL